MRFKLLLKYENVLRKRETNRFASFASGRCCLRECVCRIRLERTATSGRSRRSVAGEVLRLRTEIEPNILRHSIEKLFRFVLVILKLIKVYQWVGDSRQSLSRPVIANERDGNSFVNCHCRQMRKEPPQSRFVLVLYQ